MFFLFVFGSALLCMVVWSIRPYPVSSQQVRSILVLEQGWLHIRTPRPSGDVEDLLAALRHHTLTLHDLAWHRALSSTTDLSGPLAAVTGQVLMFEISYRCALLAVYLSFPERVVRNWQARLCRRAEAILARTLSPFFVIPTA